MTCCVGTKAKTRQNIVSDKHAASQPCSSVKTTSSRKQDVGKLKKRLVTRTAVKSRPAAVVQRKSSVWTRSSLKAHVRKCRSRWQLCCHARVSQKHAQTKSLAKRGAKSLPSTSTCITESVTSEQSVGCVVTAVEEIGSNVTKDERDIDTVTSFACVDTGPAADEKVDSFVTEDFGTSEIVTSDECVNNTGAVGEEVRSTVTGECRDSERESAECVDNASAAGEEVGLNLTEEKNCSQEPASSSSSSSSTGAASVATETRDVPSAAVSLSTLDVMVSVKSCFSIKKESLL